MKKDKINIQALPLVALELGSNGCRAMAARMNEEGLLQVLGTDSSTRRQCVEKGNISNTSDAGFSINETMSLLENRIHEKSLPYAFVSTGGFGMQAVEVNAHRTFSRKKEINSAILDELSNECKEKIEKANPDSIVVDLVLNSYNLDGTDVGSEIQPGQMANRIEGVYTAFVTRKERHRTLESFDHCPRTIEKLFVRPEALATALASAQELKRGVAIIDFGSQTTTLSIYHDEHCILNRTIPLGGFNVTRDISALGITLRGAEILKIQYSNLVLPEQDKDKAYRVPAAIEGNADVLVRLEMLTHIIQCRIDEIMAPIFEQIEANREFIQKILLTGGASMQRGLIPYLKSRCNIPLNFGSHAEWLASGTPDEYYKPRYAALVGTLLLGADHRKNNTNQVVSSQSSFKQTFDNFVGNLFSAEGY